jgi:pimeloyl-ACP methyl ester carboxylesterase
MLLQLESVRLNVIDEGTGHAVLFLHGLGANYRNWTNQLNAFRSQFRCVALDNRGAGQSECPPGPFSIDLYADDLAHLCERINVTHAHVVGHSMGAMIAQAFAVQHPELVDTLVLVDTSCHTTPQEIFEQAQEVIRNDELGRVPAMFVDAIYPREFQERYPEKVWEFGRDLIAHDPEALIKAMIAIAAIDYRPQLPKVRVPVLVVVGELDRITPPSRSELIASLIPHAQLLRFPSLGHQPHFEASQAVNVALHQFLSVHPCPKEFSIPQLQNQKTRIA